MTEIASIEKAQQPVNESSLAGGGVAATAAPAEKTAKKAAKAAPKTPYSRAIMKRRFLLGSEEAQSILSRHGDKMQKACFQIGKIIHITVDSKRASEFEDIKRKELDVINSEFDKELGRLEAIFEANAVQDPVEYSSPSEYTLEVDSQLFMKVIELLIKLDKVISYYDTLNMLTIMKEPDCREQKKRVKARLMKYCGRTIAELDKLRKLANMPEEAESVDLQIEEPIADKQLKTKVSKKEPTAREDVQPLEMIA